MTDDIDRRREEAFQAAMRAMKETLADRGVLQSADVGHRFESPTRSTEDLLAFMKGLQAGFAARRAEG